MKRTQAKAKLWLLNNKDEPIIGEGKAALLKTIKEEGSLNRACKKVNISYKHAWLLLKEIEDSVYLMNIILIRTYLRKLYMIILFGK